MYPNCSGSTAQRSISQLLLLGMARGKVLLDTSRFRCDQLGAIGDLNGKACMEPVGIQRNGWPGRLR